MDGWKTIGSFWVSAWEGLFSAANCYGFAGVRQSYLEISACHGCVEKLRSHFQNFTYHSWPIFGWGWVGEIWEIGKSFAGHLEQFGIHNISTDFSLERRFFLWRWWGHDSWLVMTPFFLGSGIRVDGMPKSRGVKTPPPQPFTFRSTSVETWTWEKTHRIGRTFHTVESTVAGVGRMTAV